MILQVCSSIQVGYGGHVLFGERAKDGKAPLTLSLSPWGRGEERGRHPLLFSPLILRRLFQEKGDQLKAPLTQSSPPGGEEEKIGRHSLPLG